MAGTPATSRRDFLKSTAGGAAGAMVVGSAGAVLGQTVPLATGPGNKWPGRVAINFNKNAVTYNASGAPAAAASVIQTMVDDTIKLLTGESTVGAAWKAVFPSSLTATSKITIKVPIGCVNTTVAPHWSSVKAVIAGLLQMNFSGTLFPKSNITVYNRLCSSKMSTYSYTAANLGLDAQNIIDDAPYPGEAGQSQYTDGANGLQYPICLKNANFLINLFRIGSHTLAVEYRTLGFKNHYGTYPAGHKNDGVLAGDSAYLRDINCIGPVYTKNVLSMCVGIFGADENSGGPGGSESDFFTYAKKMDTALTRPTGNTKLPPTTIIMSTDPITAEMQTVKIQKMNKNAAFGVTDMPKYLRGSAGESAGLSGTARNIGIISESQMDIRRMVNGNVTSVDSGRAGVSTNRESLSAVHMPGSNSTFIEYSVPQSVVGTVVSIEIHDMKGAVIRSYRHQVGSAVSQLSWDERDESGRRVRAGTYVVKIAAGSVHRSAQFAIAR